MKKPELANKAYERVLLNSPLHPYAQIQLALNLDSLDRTDEAKASLEKLIAANPGDLEAITALGNVLRGRKQFAECADVYSKGVDTISKPEKSNWVIYYFRESQPIKKPLFYRHFLHFWRSRSGAIFMSRMLQKLACVFNGSKMLPAAPCNMHAT
jgi:tetratricopeptide (TPR) repeat protein